MAEEHFTSRRERREAERLAAEQAFEARSTPEQSEEPVHADEAAEPPTPEPEPESRIDPNPTPAVVHRRGALASDHPLESRPPVSAEDRLDPQRAPLPHFDTRSERRKYLREHGLSASGDVSTGAIPVIAEPEEIEAAPTPNAPAPGPSSPEYDRAGFGGNAEEVAARDFESPVTASTPPRPAPVGEQPYDALSRPFETASDEEPSTPGTVPEVKGPAVAEEDSTSPEVKDTRAVSRDPKAVDSEAPSSRESGADAAPASDAAAAKSRPRARRMPIVQPPTTSGVRVVTAASAKIPDPEAERSPRFSPQEPSRASGESLGTEEAPRFESTGSADTAASSGTAASAQVEEPKAGSEDGPGKEQSAWDMAAHPETRPMDAIPEAWALPNSDYEDEETENPPATRIRASAVTGHDGQILVGEEPSKVPFIVLGVAALVAVALIVVALVLLL